MHGGERRRRAVPVTSLEVDQGGVGEARQAPGTGRALIEPPPDAAPRGRGRAGTGAPGTGERLPPGPSTPAAAQALEWFRRPVEWMERNRRNHGPIFRVRLGPLKRAAMISDPRAVREILRGDPDVLRMGDANGMMRPIVGSKSILLLDGEEHLEHRQLLLPYLRGDHIARYEGLIAEVAERRMSSWPLDRPFALKPEMVEIAFSTILAIALGGEPGPGEARIRALLPRMMDLCSSPFTLMPRFRREAGGLSPYGRLMAIVEELDEVIYAEILARRADPALEDREDVLSVLVRARHSDGSPLTDAELRDEAVTLLMGGSETTAMALAWAFERLARHPEAADRLAGSLEIGDRSYLDAVIRETLRQRPVIPAIVRKLAAPMELGEYLFPAGWVLMPSIYLLHHEPSMYPDPHEFRPERFLGGPPPRALWIPFGGGVRRCLGANLAMLEMRTVIEAVISRFALRPTELRPERPRRERFTLTPGDRAMVVLERRRGRPIVGRPARAAPASASSASPPEPLGLPAERAG